MLERVSIFIDGSNFYYKLKDLKVENKSEFNYRGFCDYLARNRETVFRCYYIGAVRAKEYDTQGQKLRASQINLFNNLANQEIRVEQGDLMKNNGKYHEKGVDVKIAVDLLVGAFENAYDTAILISSDTDLVPVIKKVKTLGKKVEYIGFSHQPSYGLQKNATLSRLLIKEDLGGFIKKSLV